MTVSAKVIADNIGQDAPRLVTMQWRYPKFIHGEVMTHRVFSRNASSSRAIPVERLIQDVIDDPVYPMHWGKNQPGMSADEECEALIDMQVDRFRKYAPADDLGYMMAAGFEPATREQAWDWMREQAINTARAFAAAGYHKQIVNRLLEPFCHINVVVTATEWSNFFALRDHPGAQPEIRILAQAAKKAMAESTPRKINSGDWHVPYVTPDDARNLAAGKPSAQAMIDMLIKLSVARCARVSYLTQDGKAPDIEADLKLYDRLVGSVPLHASPAEHQARPDKFRERGDIDEIGLNDYESELIRWQNSHLHGNLRGWVQYRKTLSGENQ